MIRRGFLALLIVLAGTSAAIACPDYRQPSSFGSIVLTTGFLPDPYVRNITAGGGYSLAGCFGTSYGGSVAARPDFEFQYNAGGYDLTIMVQSGYDTTLLINDPSGQWWFDDDSGGNLNPKITFANPQSGVYDIWIGSYQGGSRLPGQLVISELY